MFRENQQIGYYTLIRFLGRGGFGEVWLAERRDVSPPAAVAIKLPRGDQINLQAVKDEIFNWILSGKHKNILPIIECETFGDQIAIVSEYAPDGSLKDLLEKQGRLPVAEAVRMTAGILEGLAHLHQRKIIHRDLKPENILLQRGIPRLTDFGISRVVTNADSTAEILGTQAYMAPESFDGKRTPQTDIWAVGVIFYLLLSGKLPFPQREITQLIGAIVMQAPASLPDNVPPSLSNIALRALAKDPAQRFGSASEMFAELRSADRSLITRENPLPTFSAPFAAPLPTPAQNQAITEVLTVPSPKKKRSKIVWLVLAAALLLLATFGGAAAYGIFVIAQRARNAPASQASENNSGGYRFPDQMPTEFSAAMIDEILAADEKESYQKLKMTQFQLFKNDSQFVGGLVIAKDPAHDDYYDSYFYNFITRSVQKTPVKDPSSFHTTGGKWFYREDVNWQAIPALIEKISAKAKETNESTKNLTISATRKFIGFNPDRYGEIIIDLKISGARKDIELTADANGGNVETKVSK